MNIRDIQIKNYTGWLERAAPIVLARAGCGTVYVSQEVTRAKLPASRIDVMAIKGPAGEICVNEHGEEYPDDIPIRLIYTLSTKREQARPELPEGVKTLHEDWASRIRAAHEFKENPFGGLLPFYTVTKLDEGQNDRDLDLNFWQDYTRIPIDVRITINADAWRMSDADLSAFIARLKA